MTSVAFLVDQLFSAVPGGMGTYVRCLVPAMTRAEPSLDIALFHARPAMVGGAVAPPLLPERWMREFWVEELPQSIAGLYAGWAVARRPKLPATLSSMDLVHSPVSSAVPPAGEGQRVVVTVHDLAYVTHPELFPRRWRLMYRAGLARAVRSADALLAVSRHTAEDILRETRADPRRVHVTPLAPALPATGVDVEETLARLKIPVPYILFVGTLEPRKNLVRLIRAYRRFAARGSPHALVLTGPMGAQPQPLMRALAVEGPGRIILTGSVPAGALDALYRGASAFVYPSLYEGFGLPVLDAMARGVPCVVSASSSLTEVAGEAALPIDPRSVGGLSDAVERVVSDRNLAGRLRRAGLVRAARFSWDETARLTLEAYKSVL